MSIAHPHLPSGAPLGTMKRAPRRSRRQPGRLHLHVQPGALLRRFDDRPTVERNASPSELVLRPQITTIHGLHR